ncbi:ribonuclease HI [Sulfurospirillum barnesii]|uniref:Ribonuclease H n=1 Tax=Sulfurospirillum barnesii (strain ATCC 700032 / DSM 10660 / SES-3) TaxID=760154 RepID=I3XZJ6_SULBS|nr:ribonuclease HI [Sulfurospirillum barnesii]AFL69370.1 ribonuclease HI [Sulfurospirillum barnesii SES-3]
MKKISLFSDGSSLGNPGAGGYCAILRFGDVEKIVSGGMADATNNQMELLAVIKGLEALREPCEVTIISDSSYVVKGINEWLGGWVKKGFAKVKNPELWQAYLQASKGHKVKGVWVRGHDGHTENEMCDKIAKEEAMKIKEKG